MTKYNALVSVIVPVYGAEAYLPACIDSICRQSYPYIQIVLVDDQSPDRCPDICECYAKKDSRIVVVHQENKGVSGARNTGISYATGDFIMFVDSDDELETNAVEILMQDILQYNADIASATKRIVLKDGTLKYLCEDGEICIYEGDEMIKRSLKYERTTRSLHAKLFSKRFIDNICFAEGHNINEDGYFLFECYTKCPKVVEHNVSVYKYFHRENSISRSVFSEKYLDMLYFCDLKMKYIREKIPAYIEIAKNMEVRTHILFLDVLCRNKDSKYKDIEKKCIKTIRKRCFKFQPISKHERLVMIIAIFGLYSIYKKLVCFKYYR